MSNINNRKVAPNNVNDDLFNEKIPFKEVLVIDVDGTQLGVMSKKEALDIAYKQNLDLLCVAPKARPAVCKVLDYGRFAFPYNFSPRLIQHFFPTALKLGDTQ